LLRAFVDGLIDNDEKVASSLYPIAVIAVEPVVKYSFV